VSQTELYPDIKINLFVPARYARLQENPHPLIQNPEWCERVNELPSNFQVGMHGLYHRSSSDDFNFHTTQSNNDEFRYLNTEQAEVVVNEMINEFEQSGLKYAKIFRPPRWSISYDVAQILTKRGFTIAGHDDYFQQCKGIEGLKWVSVNWHLIDVPPPQNIIAAGHTSDWTYNYFNQERFELVKKVLEGQEWKFRFIV